MKALLIGFGEVGEGIYGAWKERHAFQVLDPMKDIRLEKYNEPDVLLIAIPWSETFHVTVSNYQEYFKPKLTIIFSTVPIGTTRKLKNAVHSPIEGRHMTMSRDISSACRWIGANDSESLSLAEQFFLEASVDLKEVYTVDNSDHSEFLKLRSLAYYGICIEFARYSANVCKFLKMDYLAVKDYDRGYNDLVRCMGKPEFSRPVLDAPNGEIGGHCVLQNSVILNRQFDHPFISELLQRNGYVSESSWHQPEMKEVQRKVFNPDSNPPISAKEGDQWIDGETGEVRRFEKGEWIVVDKLICTEDKP
jgi:hypothetical protein